MTDNEIIKALECCTSWGCGTSCADCPLYNTGCLHFNKLGETLDLINRQQAEIERLQNENNQLAYIGKLYSEVKAEAIKEFAERLKANRTKLLFSSTGFNKQIDNLVKEMVGDTE